MDLFLQEALRAGRIDARAVLDFLGSKDAPTSWDEAWRINDRISHLVQDDAWCAAVAQASHAGTEPRTEELRHLVAHRSRLLFDSRAGKRGAPDYWGDAGLALSLRPNGVHLDLALDESGNATVRIESPNGRITRTGSNPAACVCWCVLKHLERADPNADTVLGPKSKTSPYILGTDAQDRSRT